MSSREDQEGLGPRKRSTVHGTQVAPRLEARIALGALAPELLRLERQGPREVVDSFLVRGPRRLELHRAA